MKLSYGWVIVAIGIAVTCIGMGSMMSLGVFLQPMAQSMGWSRTGISTTALLNFLAMGAGSFLWGALSDRFGGRVVVLAGGVLLALGLAGASQAETLLQFQLSHGIAIGLAAGAFYVPLTALTVRWFVTNRSLAVALVSAGMGLGSTLVAPLARWIILHHDWRTALLTLAAMALAIVLPAALLLREPPSDQPMEAAPRAGTPAHDRQDMTLAQAIRTPQFAAIAVANFLCCAAHSGPIFHMVSYAVDCGVGDMTAASVFSAAGLAALSGRVLCGIVADRTGAKRTLVAALALQAAAIALYLASHDLAMLYVTSALFGFSYGGAMPLYAILVRMYFPARLMGSVFGVVNMIATLGMALGPVTGGWLFDHFGTYAWLYTGSAGIGLGAVLIALAVRAPGRWRAVAA